MWKKLNFHFKPPSDITWAVSHASVPTPLILNNTQVRIYYSTRDQLSRNRTGAVELKIIDESIEILNYSNKPILELGDEGHFDCDGIYGTSIVQKKEKVYFYYAGWNAGLRGLFYSSIGVAISEDMGKTFRKYSTAPILSRDSIDPWACMAPYVMNNDDGSWIMWYTSGIQIKTNNSGIESLYDIKTATSKDGVNWEKSGKTAISLGEKDTNIARSCVIYEENKYKAWYPYVSRGLGQYRIGYAESDNGFKFERMDLDINAQISPSLNSNSWDSLAVTYPFVFELNNNRYMLYNGNGFGKTGFGMAIWK